MTAEHSRLDDDVHRRANWKRWGPYLAERQWATVREDYSADGDVWNSFPHDHARSRAYRWGEDGLLGICDRECRLAFALALWNGRDPILKERLFGLTGPQGNHGEDAKECWYYLDATPTYSYAKALYKYPQTEFPYEGLIDENARRSVQDREFEIEDTGAFDESRYFDVTAEYAKAAPDDILIRITVANRGPDAATMHLLPHLWFHNSWSWGRRSDEYWTKPSIVDDAGSLLARHETLPHMRLSFDVSPAGDPPALLFTDNETNYERLFGVANASPWVKDAFHRYVIEGDAHAINPAREGTRAAGHWTLALDPGEATVLRLRLRVAEDATPPFGDAFDDVFALRMREADEFYATVIPAGAAPDEDNVARQAYGSLLWSKQFYHYVVSEWLDGDPAQPPPPPSRLHGRNADWRHVHNRDVLSMPDKWEYPWFAAWDLAFHMVPLSKVDPASAKKQLLLLLREWYTHPNGQMPAYEFAFGDVNPPVHAWACWRVYKTTGPRGQRDRLFLQRAFHKLMLNFTWWVNRKDFEGNHLFAGGFLGLDNIGVFDRSRPLPTGGHLEQADGTAWMAFYCTTMLAIALELASEDPAYEDIASKFFEHFVAIADAMNTLGGNGLWNERDGFYYDQIHADNVTFPVRLRSMVGVIPLFAAEILQQDVIAKLPGFAKRTRWFIDNRPDVARDMSCLSATDDPDRHNRLLAIPTRERLERVLRYVLDENEFLSPYGIRSLSRRYVDRPYILRFDGHEYTVRYTPGESTTHVFGGNSNWRGPVWFPLNYLLIEALERYHHFYGDDLRVEFPTGSGNRLTLKQVAAELGARLSRLFLRDANGARPCFGGDRRYADDPHWRDLLLFHEYFDGDEGRGVGASHQTGWTALVARTIEDLVKTRGDHP